MQKIFYNARFLTMNEKFETSEAMLVNDDSIVFVGESNEVLQMKTDDVEMVDLKNKFVIPTFFDLNLGIYSIIENELKNAKKDKYIENLDTNDENYENFCNFDIYLKEFEKIQNSLLSVGVTTVQEVIKSKQEFIFWKKLSESGKLKIDIIGYVEFLKNKQIMDDNCRSFRKYKNGFRLGGYYFNLDGNILEKKAWLKKPYPHEKKYAGYGEFVDEQLMFVIKTSLEEKKQMIVHASGSAAVDQFLRCYEEQTKEKPVEDNFRPVILGCNFISKKMLAKMNELKIVPNFEIDNLISNHENLKKYFGFRKLKKEFPLKDVQNNKFKILFSSNDNFVFDNFGVAKFLINQNSNIAKGLGKKHKFDLKTIFETLFLTSAFYSFDLDQKGSLESGKKADFVVIDNDICDIENSDVDFNVLQVYKNGELIFKCNKK